MLACERRQAIGGNGENSQLSFEQALAALEEIVQRLASGSVPLDESIALYERGEVLRKQCQARLDTAAQRIRKVEESREGEEGGQTVTTRWSPEPLKKKK